MEGIFDAYMVENGGFLTTADLAYESAEVIFDNKFAHLEYDYEKLMMEHDEHLKMIELKILTENGTAEDYEYLIVQEAEAVKTESKGIFGGLLLFTGYNFLTRLSGSFLAGIIIFCIGAVNIALSYPLYNHLVAKARKKYAPVVLTVTKYLGQKEEVSL